MSDAPTDPDPKTDSAAPATTRPLDEILGVIVRLGTGAISAHRCVVAWTDPAGIAHVIHAPETGERWDSTLSAAIAALDNKLTDLPRDLSSRLQRVELSKREIASFAGDRRYDEAGAALAAAAFVDGASPLRIAVATPADRDREEVEALLELVARAAITEIAAGAATDSLEYWRAQSVRLPKPMPGGKAQRPDAHASGAQRESNLQALVAALQAEAESRRALVSRLALRMFTAIDEERARIARDLHDDQAQLLAAAQIALEGGRAEARTIFKQVELALRSKIRELKPVTLGGATLAEAIEREFPRLQDAGVAAAIVCGAEADQISRPVQQLCFQVVREAISNVIRHARAKSVEVRIERDDALARVTVADNGRGIASKAGAGAGLAGVRERLELMGGSLMLKSGARGTVVVAEIPEPETPVRD